MKKTFVFLLLFSFLFVEIIPSTSAYAGPLTKAFKAARKLKVSRYRVPKAPRYRAPKTIRFKPPKVAPTKIPAFKVTKIYNSSPVKIGNATLYGKNAASALRNRARAVSFPQKTANIKVNQGSVNKLSGNVKQTNKLLNKNSNYTGRLITKNGRSGKQQRLKEIMNDDKVGSADRGWLQNDMRHIKTGNKAGLRVPRNGRKSPGRKSTDKGYELAHPHNKPASKGNSYKGSKMKNYADHKAETKLHKKKD